MLEERISLEVCGLWTSVFRESAFYLRSLHSTSGQVRHKNATTYLRSNYYKLKIEISVTIRVSVVFSDLKLIKSEVVCVSDCSLRVFLPCPSQARKTRV